MKITRSSKTSLKFITEKKRGILDEIMDEYSRVANIFTEMFFGNNFQRKDLKKDIISIPSSWFSARMRQCCAREALGMVQGAVRSSSAGSPTAAAKGIEPVKPNHTGRKMILSSQCVRIEKGRNSFDLWLIIHSVGNKIKLQIPVKSHRHMNLFSDWKLCDSVTVHREYVMFSFEKETETKKTEGKLIGIDCGINHLMADSEGVLYGSEVKTLINIIKRKKQGSKAYKRAKKTLSYYIHKTVKELDFSNLRLAVCEKLKGLKQGKKKNRSKAFRKTLSNWNYGELLRIIRMRCEENRVSFRSVIPYKTSQMCPSCAHTERDNRVNENFKCLKQATLSLKCGYSWTG